MALAIARAMDIAPAKTEQPFRGVFVSVIVPTYNRAFVLPYLMGSLARQIYPADLMELVIVDNSSSDDTETVVREWSRRVPFQVRFYRKENRGPAASRNFGAARAVGEILAFTDSDCVPAADWLRNGVRAFADGTGIVCAPFLPAERPGDSLLVAQQDAITRDRGCYPTANLFVRRADFQAVDGFDESFGMYPWGELYAGEDTDLAWRIRRRGVRAVFTSDAVVWHLATPASLGRLLLRPLVAQIIPALVGSIPELREMYLWRRYFNDKVHLYFHLAWLGALAASLARMPVLGLLALPWVGHQVRRVLVPSLRSHGLRRGTLRFLLLLYRQVACALVMVGASIRYRRVVL